MLQSSLPKRYALLEYKPGKRNATGSAVKYAQEEVIFYCMKESQLVKGVGEFREH